MAKPSKCITVAEAKALQKKWKETRGEVVTNEKTHKDTCEFHYSLDEIQGYLDYIKNMSKDPDTSNLGINIWLGAYPEADGKPSLSTIFITATKKKTGELVEGEKDYEENSEIEPFNTVIGEWPPNEY